jgi:hypothetical protein
LASLFHLVRQKAGPLPVGEAEVRKALVALPSWDLGDAEANQQILGWFEGWLTEAEVVPTAPEIGAYLRASEAFHHPIDLRAPAVSAALVRAARAGNLGKLRPEEQALLLVRCQPLVQDVAAGSVPGMDPLPAMVELAAAIHAAHSAGGREVLARWRSLLRFQPQALASLSDDEFLGSPLRGIGSPCGMLATVYHGATGETVRVDWAGTTPDERINEHLFAGLYAMGLAVQDGDAVALTEGGSVASSPTEQVSQRPNEHRLISAVIGPGGLVEPRPGLANLGMGWQEALDVTMEVLRGSDETTGLVTVTQCDESEARLFDLRCRQMIEARGTGTQTVKSSLAAASSPAVRVQPWYHRDADGKASPIEIAIPVKALGLPRLHSMLTAVRRLHMRQLRENCKRREDLAREILESQKGELEHWQSLSPEERAKRCEISPFVEIHWNVDFELGRRVRLAKPEQVPRMLFESKIRPQLCVDAARYVERFQAIGHQIEEIDKSGGRADRLSTKLLIDCMVRGGRMPVPDEAFQSVYGDWVEVASTPVRTAVEGWALSHGLDPVKLGATNVMFDSRFDPKSDHLVLCPQLLVDLHDHELVFDQAKGIMWANPASGTTLAQAVVPDQAAGIRDVASLRSTLARWVGEVFGARPHIEDARREIASLIEAQHERGEKGPSIHDLMILRQARRLVLSGHYQGALVIIEKLRRLDLAPVYFWGAVCHQCVFFSTQAARLFASSNGEKVSPAERLFNVAVGTLVAHTRYQREQGGLDLAGMLPRLIGRTEMPARPPVGEQARQYWGQLEERDGAFVQALVAGSTDLPSLEAKALNISQVVLDKVDASVSALQALDLLACAEVMRDKALAIPLIKTHDGKVADIMSPILKRLGELPFTPSQHEAEVRELCGIVGAGGAS